MGSLFSRNKSKVNQHDKAVLDLKVARDKLTQYQKKITKVIEAEQEAARKLLKEGKKQQALLCIKKKKFQESLLAKSEAQLSNIQEMVDSIEFTQMEKDVFDSLKSGNDVLKELHEELNVEDVEELMLDTEEGIARQKEIDEAISRQLNDEDEADIEAEFAALEAEFAEADLDLPAVPDHELKDENKKPQKETEAKSEPEAVLA